MTHGHWYSTVKKALKTSSSTPPRCTGLLSVDPSTGLLPRVGIDSKMVPAVAILLFGTLKRVFPTLERPVSVFLTVITKKQKLKITWKVTVSK